MAHAKHHDARDTSTVRAVVVTVSDTRTLEDDVGGSLVAELLTGAGHLVERRVIVRDDAGEIRRAVQGAIDAGAEVVVTTGGTGISPRDVTYEAVASLLDKTLEGFGEAFRRLSWDEIGARAVLSRAIAGVSRETLVIALPGSPKAVHLAMNAIVLPLVGHAVGLLR
jgi:molybdenum cofactor biosynthesis protein B